MKITREELFNLGDRKWKDVSQYEKFDKAMNMVNKYYRELPKDELTTMEDHAEEILNSAVKDKAEEIITSVLIAKQRERQERFNELGLVEWLQYNQRVYIKDSLIPALSKVKMFGTRITGWEGLVNKEQMLETLETILEHNGYTEEERNLLRKLTRLHRQRKTPFR